jgi:hypothetical protein
MPKKEDKKDSASLERAASIVEPINEWLDTTQGKIAGAGVAGLATLMTARDAINRAYFKSMNKPGADTFTDLQTERDQKIGEVVAPVKKGIEVPDAMDRVAVINRQYDTKLAERRRLMGIHSIFDEAKALKRHQWMEVLMSTGAVAAVGAILAINSNRDIAQRQKELDEAVENKVSGTSPSA